MGTSKDHVNKIKKTGFSWVSNLKSNKFVKPVDGWLSFDIQLQTKLEWGLVYISAPPDELTATMDSVQHTTLSHLRVNKQIYKAV